MASWSGFPNARGACPPEHPTVTTTRLAKPHASKRRRRVALPAQCSLAPLRGAGHRRCPLPMRECDRTAHSPFRKRGMLTERQKADRAVYSQEPAFAFLSDLPVLARLADAVLFRDLGDGDVPPRVIAWHSDRGIDRHVDNGGPIRVPGGVQRGVERCAISGAVHFSAQ